MSKNNLFEKTIKSIEKLDWPAITKLKPSDIEKNKERKKLSLISIIAHLQQDQVEKANEMILKAIQWNCSKSDIYNVILGSIDHSLGKTALCIGNTEQANKHLHRSAESINEAVDIDSSDHNLNAIKESGNMGLLLDSTDWLKKAVTEIKKEEKLDQAKILVIESEIDLLKHELTLALQRKQLKPIVEGAREHEGQPEENIHQKLEERSCSQLGQDIWVLEETNYKRNGFFVEFGATNGVLLSNTYLLEKEFGWDGVCAEPNPNFFKDLVKNRNCIVSDACIGQKTGEQVEFILADEFGGMKKHTSDDQHKSKREAYEKICGSKTINTISLHDLLISHKAPKTIDYLSIDTEGSEYEILSSFPFDKWDIRLLTIEHNFTKNREKIKKLLAKYGYKRKEEQWDDWYQRI